VVLDEADPGLLDATLAIVDAECGSGERLEDSLVDRWLSHRNDVSALAPLWRAGIVVDTIEVSARWSALAGITDDVISALSSVQGTLVASVHQSHAYPDGACLYFTFAGRATPDAGERTPEAQPEGTSEGSAKGMEWEEDYYRRAWDAAIGAVTRHGGAISHHHGIGLNRSRFLAAALGTGFEVLVAVKQALDPAGILNPGKLGLPTTFGEVPWP